ncbi:MAG: sensor histidine kinase [Verrucomicrobiota bacterium]
MHFPTRSISLAMVLLLLFLVAALTLQWWLVRETRQLQRLAVDEQRGRLERIIAVSGLPPERWDAYFQKELGAMVGGTVELYRTAAPPAAPAAPPGNLVFTETIARVPGWEARVSFAAPALIRTQVMHQRILAVIILLALLLALVPMLAALLEARRPPGEGASRSPWAAARAQAAGFEELARLSHERSAALAREHAARARAEQDLQVNRSLLDRSLAERVRLGRELHDNICQTLYAVCLTLESVQKKSALGPEMSDRMQQCLAELRRLNQEVRAYLQDLEPGRVNGQSFGAALAGMLGSLPPEDEVRIQRRLDPEAVELISPGQVAEIMNILREAVSNSLRHGQARQIILRAGRSDDTVALSVQDDGVGFAAERRQGHGLDNMRARAQSIGGDLQIESAPGKGTRVILTLPAAHLTA